MQQIFTEKNYMATNYNKNIQQRSKLSNNITIKI
ncbi:MAG: hypothetical protein DGJ47_000273 [Rickettsiaceae bacterium]